MIIDVCAAPGGKSLTTACRMAGKGRVVACDVYEEKTQAMAARAARLGGDLIEIRQRDASTPCPDDWVGAFDRVICDVPCSGLGVIRRRPEIRYKAPESFKDLPQLQYRILCESAAMVKPGGVLQYSTCTWNPAENEEIAARFLNEYPDFLPRPLLALEAAFAAAGQAISHQITLLPSIHGTDGFFIASFTKN